MHYLTGSGATSAGSLRGILGFVEILRSRSPEQVPQPLKVEIFRSFHALTKTRDALREGGLFLMSEVPL